MALREITLNQTATAGQSSEVLCENLMENIPFPMQIPKVEHLSDTRSLQHVVFDIEMTSKYLYDADIIQLSAACGESNFNVYITPQRPIQFNDSRFSIIEEGLCFEGQPVSAESSAKEALKKFICWLKNCDVPVILLAHNCKNFDAQRLVLHLVKHNLLEDLKANVVGFLDTLTLFKDHLSMKERPSLKFLMEKYIPDYVYREHDSSEDVRALKKLLDKTSVDIEDKHFNNASFSLAYEIANVEYLLKRKHNEETLVDLPVTKGMKKKIAGSGLQYSDLELANERAGKEGLKRVLSETVNDKPRVTKLPRIISDIYKHFNGDAL